MLLVLASIDDPHAPAGAAHWRAAGLDVRVVTCHDLAQPGWRLTLDDPPTLVVDGERVPSQAVGGVITRLAWVLPEELPFVAEEDRDYAAAEMQAFLLALLAQLPCPVLNRPTPGCLSGPSWSAERWVRCAASVDVAVHPIVHRAYAGGAAIDEPPYPPVRSVHVVGDRSFGDAPEDAHRAARAIAGAAGTELLRVAFVARARAPVFVHADPSIDVSDAEIAGAVARRFRP